MRWRERKVRERVSEKRGGRKCREVDEMEDGVIRWLYDKGEKRGGIESEVEGERRARRVNGSLESKRRKEEGGQ